MLKKELLPTTITILKLIGYLITLRAVIIVKSFDTLRTKSFPEYLKRTIKTLQIDIQLHDRFICFANQMAQTLSRVSGHKTYWASLV